jgi:hypothetical protein
MNWWRIVEAFIEAFFVAIAAEIIKNRKRVLKRLKSLIKFLGKRFEDVKVCPSKLLQYLNGNYILLPLDISILFKNFFISSGPATWI